MVGRKKQQGSAVAAMEEGEAAKNSHGSSPHFFKVFFPQQSTNRLRIPPGFNQHLENEPPGVISLKGPSGNMWCAELISDSEGLFFVRGWKEFVNDHSIKAGDFLVFRYDGHSRFSVLVFDETACEKQSAFFAHPCKDKVIKIEDEEEDAGRKEITSAGTSNTTAITLGESIGTMRKRARGVDDHPMTNGLPPKKYSDCLEKAREKLPRTSFGSSQTTKPTSLCSMRDSSSSVLIIPDENISSKKSAKSVSVQLKMSNSVPRRGKTVAKVQRMPVVLSQRRPITEEEKSSTLKRAMAFKSKNPFALQVMKDSYVYVGFFMNIPCEFVREYLPKVSRKITLWDPQEKPWEVNYVYYTDRSVGSFSGGWGAFAVGNNLEKYDVCVFELIRKNNIKVHIYRVVPEITPLIRKSGKK